jgi:hypothetical protein
VLYQQTVSTLQTCVYDTTLLPYTGRAFNVAPNSVDSCNVDIFLVTEDSVLILLGLRLVLIVVALFGIAVFMNVTQTLNKNVS